jgi:hypothetical protein
LRLSYYCGGFSDYFCGKTFRYFSQEFIFALNKSSSRSRLRRNGILDEKFFFFENFCFILFNRAREFFCLLFYEALKIPFRKDQLNFGEKFGRRKSKISIKRMHEGV